MEGYKKVPYPVGGQLSMVKSSINKINRVILASGFDAKSLKSLAYIEFSNANFSDKFYDSVLSSFGGKDPKKLLESSGIHISKMMTMPESQLRGSDYHDILPGVCIAIEDGSQSMINAKIIESTPNSQFNLFLYEFGDIDYIDYIRRGYHTSPFIYPIFENECSILGYTNSNILNDSGPTSNTVELSIILAAGERFKL